MSSQAENHALACRALVRKAQREEARLRSIIASEHGDYAEKVEAVAGLRKFIHKRALLLADIDESFYAISPFASREALARLTGYAARR